MQDRFTIKNFRVFNKEGATFSFSPITFLTGTNSSGKSSLTKAIMLLHDFFQQGFNSQAQRGRRYFDPCRYSLDFTNPELKLGGFNSEVNRLSGVNEIGFSYSYRPSIAPFYELNINYYFSASNTDSLNQGWLSRIEITAPGSEDENDTLLQISVKDGAPHVDLLNLNKRNLFLSFLRFYYVANIRCLEIIKQSCYDPSGDIVDQDRYNQVDQVLNDFYAIIKDLTITKREAAGADLLFSDQDRMTIEEYKSLYPHILDNTLLTALNTLNKDKILLYFPLFDELKYMKKEQVCERILSAELFINTFETKDGVLAHEIAEDFRKSEFDSFVDYYREKEDEKLNNVIVPGWIQFIDDDLLSRIERESDIFFGDNPNTTYGTDTVDFDKLYRFLSNWQWKRTPEREDDYISRWAESYDFYSSRHKLYSALIEYVCLLLHESLLPPSFKDIHYIGISHVELRRLYSFEDKDNSFTRRILAYHEAKRQYSLALKEPRSGKNTEFRPGDFINKWIKGLEIGDSLLIDIDSDSLGAKLRLKKSVDDTGASLSDEGYGVNQLIALLIGIETEILQIEVDRLKHKTDQAFNQTSKLYDLVQQPVTIIVEEPEVNLHPALQSKLAEVFLDATSLVDNRIHFIIETHSEYLIRATQVYVAKQKYKEDEIQNKNPFRVYYLPKEGQPYDLEYTPTGRFMRKFGDGFFDAAGSLNFELIKMERNK